MSAELPPPRISRWEQFRRLSLRWLISTLAIFAAERIVPGIDFAGPGWELGIVAVVFGLVNALLRPLLMLMTCPLLILTLGLFGLVINAILLWLTAQIASWIGVQFVVDGLWPAVLGGLVISLVSLVLGILAGETPPVRVIVRNNRTPRDQ